MSHRILIVDDDPHIRQVLAFALGKAGMQTAEASDGEGALDAIAAQRPDLVVLDINMPRMNGLDVCRKLRADRRSADPLPLLARRRDRPRARAGAGRRRLCREALLAARGGRPGQRDPEARRPRARGSGRRCARSRTAGSGSIRKLGGANGTTPPVPLTVTEFQLLLLLASLPSKVFSRDAIIDRLHGPGFAITDRTIDSHIRNLRHKFAAVGGPDLIETRAGIGYRIGPCRGDGA